MIVCQIFCFYTHYPLDNIPYVLCAEISPDGKREDGAEQSRINFFSHLL